MSKKLSDEKLAEYRGWTAHLKSCVPPTCQLAAILKLGAVAPELIKEIDRLKALVKERG